jgi:hypothetical protein
MSYCLTYVTTMTFVQQNPHPMKTLELIAVTILSFALDTSHAGVNEDLVAACKIGDLEKVKSAIEGGANVNQLTDGNPPLSVAFFWPEVTKYLLEKGADPNLGDFPALLNTIIYYSTDVLKILLDAGADPNKAGLIDPSKTFKTLIATEKEKGKAANKDLIKAWENAMATMKPSKMYPLYQAVYATGCATCVDLLIKKGAKLELGVTDGTLIHTFATSYGTGKSRDLWAKQFPYMKPALAPYGFTVFPDWYSADMPDDRFGSPDEMLKILLATGLNIDQKNKGLNGLKPSTPLGLGFQLSLGIENEVLLALLNNGADGKAAGLKFEPTDFTNETSNIEKIKVRFDFPGEGRNSSNGGGYSANMDLVNPKPKRVALISYYLYDPGKGKTTGGTYVGTATSSVWRTSDVEGQMQVDGFYSKSINQMKAAFKENGIDLLTPDQFLDTDEKFEFYFGFDQESSKKEKTAFTKRKAAGTSISSVASATVSTLKVCPTGKGFRPFFVANEQGDESMITNFQSGIFSANRKLTSSLGNDLAKGLGVDAVVVVYICTRQPKQIKSDYAVNAVVTMMLGPNPVRSDGSDPEAKNMGQFYCGTRTFYSSPIIFKQEKGFGQYDGMANVLTVHANKMGRYINGTEKDKDN